MSLGTFLSRILGLVRQIFMASIFGTGMAMDAWGIAFPIPNALRNILGEGGITRIFLPKYADVLEKKGKEYADSFTTTLFIFVISALILTSIALYILAPQIIPIYVKHWQDEPAKMQLTINLIRLFCPYIFFMGIYAFFMGYLNSHKKFFLPAVAPALYNIIWLLGLFYVYKNPSNETTGIITVGLFILGGTFLQFVIQVLPAKKLGFFAKINISQHIRDIKHFGYLFIPILVAGSIMQLNMFVDRYFASTLPEGYVSSMRYANLLIQFPFSMITAAIATASLPSMSQSTARDNTQRLVDISSSTIGMSFSLLIPISLVAIALRSELVSMFFQYGNFSGSNSTPLTAWALMFYIIGLCGHSGVRILQQAFYSLQDTWTPVIVGMFSMVINGVLNWLLVKPLEHGGLALATSIAALLYFATLYIILEFRLRKFDSFKTIKTILYFTGIGFTGSLIAWGIASLLKAFISTNILVLDRLVYFFVPAIFAFVFIFACYKLFKFDEYEYLIKPIFRKILSPIRKRLSR